MPRIALINGEHIEWDEKEKIYEHLEKFGEVNCAGCYFYLEGRYVNGEHSLEALSHLSHPPYSRHLATCEYMSVGTSSSTYTYTETFSPKNIKFHIKSMSLEQRGEALCSLVEERNTIKAKYEAELSEQSRLKKEIEKLKNKLEFKEMNDRWNVEQKIRIEYQGKLQDWTHRHRINIKNLQEKLANAETPPTKEIIIDRPVYIDKDFKSMSKHDMFQYAVKTLKGNPIKIEILKNIAKKEKII